MQLKIILVTYYIKYPRDNFERSWQMNSLKRARKMKQRILYDLAQNMTFYDIHHKNGVINTGISI